MFHRYGAARLQEVEYNLRRKIAYFVDQSHDVGMRAATADNDAQVVGWFLDLVSEESVNMSPYILTIAAVHNAVDVVRVLLRHEKVDVPLSAHNALAEAISAGAMDAFHVLLADRRVPPEINAVRLLWFASIDDRLDAVVKLAPLVTSTSRRHRLVIETVRGKHVDAFRHFVELGWVQWVNTDFQNAVGRHATFEVANIFFDHVPPVPLNSAFVKMLRYGNADMLRATLARPDYDATRYNAYLRNVAEGFQQWELVRML